MNLFQTNDTKRGSLTGVLSLAGALSLLLPVLAFADGERGGTPDDEGDGGVSDQRSSSVSAPDEELVGTLPIFWDPDTGMPTPDDPNAEPDDGEDDDDVDPQGGGGGLVGPDLPGVQGAPKLFLYGPYHLLGQHQSAFDASLTGEFHFDNSNPGFAYLVLEGAAEFTVSADLFTVHGIETGILVGDDELDPVLGSVSYLGQFSRPFLLDAASKKDLPIAALCEYGFLLDGVGMFTRSTTNGRSYLQVKGSTDSIYVQYTLY